MRIYLERVGYLEIYRRFDVDLVDLAILAQGIGEYTLGKLNERCTRHDVRITINIICIDGDEHLFERSVQKLRQIAAKIGLQNVEIRIRDESWMERRKCGEDPERTVM